MIKRGFKRLVNSLRPSRARAMQGPMSEQEMLTLGSFCAQVMREDNFVTICSRYEQANVEMILQTQPADAAIRESLYAKVSGFREFLSSMADLAEAAEAIKAKNDPLKKSDDFEE